MQETELKEIILTKLPSEVGFDGHSNWTLAFMVLLVEQKWEVSYTPQRYVSHHGTAWIESQTSLLYSDERGSQKATEIPRGNLPPH